jgi:hypothetical protein
VVAVDERHPVFLCVLAPRPAQCLGPHHGVAVVDLEQRDLAAPVLGEVADRRRRPPRASPREQPRVLEAVDRVVRPRVARACG